MPSASKSTSKKSTSSTSAKVFTKGQKVRVKTHTFSGICEVVRLVPKAATRGDARLTVVTKDGTERRPYPNQCTVI